MTSPVWGAADRHFIEHKQPILVLRGKPFPRSRLRSSVQIGRTHKAAVAAIEDAANAAISDLLGRVENAP